MHLSFQQDSVLLPKQFTWVSLWAVLLFLVYCPVSSSHFSSNNFQYHFPPLFNIFALCQTERYDTDKTTLVFFTSVEITILYYLLSNAPQTVALWLLSSFIVIYKTKVSLIPIISSLLNNISFELIFSSKSWSQISLLYEKWSQNNLTDKTSYYQTISKSYLLSPRSKPWLYFLIQTKVLIHLSMTTSHFFI